MRRLSRGLLIGAIAGTAATAMQATPAVAVLTPEGPATLSSVWRGPSTAEGRPPEVLQAFTVTVDAGGAAGLVRLRASDPSTDSARGVVLGSWVTLPAEPGTYTFPAPRIDFDYRSLVLALDQQSGGHAIVAQEPCAPEHGRWGDRCQLVSLDAWTPILADGLPGLPPELAGGTAPTSRQAGASLEVRTVSEVDVDGDLAGDRTEDRTDLVVSGSIARGADGRLTVTVTNRGMRTADLPRVTVDRAGLSGWSPACATPTRSPWASPPLREGSSCWLPPLAPGASHTVAVAPGRVEAPIGVTVSAEGLDLTPADNTVSVVPPAPALAPAPTVALKAPSRVRARRGVPLRIRSDVAATATMRLSLRHRGATRHATKRVALRPGAGRALTLRLARVGGEIPSGRARLTVTVAAPGRETRVVRRAVRLVR
jgi:hypothetical protein